jgi:hypothetical protein
MSIFSECLIVACVFVTVLLIAYSTVHLEISIVDLLLKKAPVLSHSEMSTLLFTETH